MSIELGKDLFGDAVIAHQSQLPTAANKFHIGNLGDGKHYWLTRPTSTQSWMRNALTAQNQSDSYGQPSDLTDAGLPSPARALSNLSGGIPGSGISFSTPARAAQVMG